MEAWSTFPTTGTSADPDGDEVDFLKWLISRSGPDGRRREARRPWSETLTTSGAAVRPVAVVPGTSVLGGVPMCRRSSGAQQKTDGPASRPGQNIREAAAGGRADEQVAAIPSPGRSPQRSDDHRNPLSHVVVSSRYCRGAQNQDGERRPLRRTRGDRSALEHPAAGGCRRRKSAPPPGSFEGNGSVRLRAASAASAHRHQGRLKGTEGCASAALAPRRPTLTAPRATALTLAVHRA